MIGQTVSHYEILELLGASHRRAKRVMVLGGGAVGTRIADQLDIEGADVVLIEHDMDMVMEMIRQLYRK